MDVVKVVYFKTQDDFDQKNQGFEQGKAFSPSMLDELRRQIPPTYKFTGYILNSQWVSYEIARKALDAANKNRWPRPIE